jgi:hypothetical protein
MGNPNAINVALCLTLGAGCAAFPVPDPEPGEAPAPAVPRAPAAAGRLAPPDLVAFSSSGELALVDGTTGAVRQTVAAPGGPGECDLVWDRWAQRLLVFQGDADDGGEIAAYPVLPVRGGVWLGARRHEAWVDGWVRLLPAPAGAIVFEEGYGERWSLLAAGPTVSVSAPMPAAAWLAVDPGGAVLHALTVSADPPALERREAFVGAMGLSVPAVTPLAGAPASLPATARLVPAPAVGDAILVDVDGASLVVRRLDGGTAGPASLVPLPSAGLRIEAAVPLRGGAVVALLMSGSPRVMAVAVDGSGVWSVAHLPLPGDVAPAERFFSRDLAAQGHSRLLVATSTGVHAVRVSVDDETGVALAVLPSFAGGSLRGPLAVIDPSP